MRKAVLAACVAAAAVVFQLTAMAQTPQAPKPGPAHERLGYFVGKWTSQGEAKPGPFGPGGKITSTDSCEWFEGRFAVICHSEGTTPMGRSKSIGILGYNTEEKFYTYYAVDNMNMNMSSVPRGTVQGDTWTYTDESSMGGKTMKTRVTIKELSPSAYTFKMELQGPDGTWIPMVEAKNTKTK